MRVLVLALCISCSTQPDDSGPGVPSAPGDPVDAGEAPDPGQTRAVNDADFLDAAVIVIDAASTRIRVAEYVLYDDGQVAKLTDALIEAVDRGVTVQVLADETGDETESVLHALALGGVDTQLDDPNVTLHNKLIIADDVVLVGSHNFTGSALRYNHEGSMLVNDAEVASWYATWYDAVWSDWEPVLPDWSRTDLVPVADRMITDTLLACIDEASLEVDVLMYAIAWNELYPDSDVGRLLTALEIAHRRGVTVRVVVDGSDWIVDNAINDEAIARLRLAAIPVWRTPSVRTTHAKVLRCDDSVVVGDTNWSYSGLELVHGTSLVVRQDEIVADYVGWMDGIRASATALP